MAVFKENLGKMMAVWNSADPKRQAALVEDALEHNVHFVDPNHNIIGRQAFLAMVEEFQKRIPGAVVSPTSKIDVQNNFCRYHWAIHHGGKLFATGFDVAEVTDSGKIIKVIGFFGELGKTEA